MFFVCCMISGLFVIGLLPLMQAVNAFAYAFIQLMQGVLVRKHFQMFTYHIFVVAHSRTSLCLHGRQFVYFSCRLFIIFLQSNT